MIALNISDTRAQMGKQAALNASALLRRLLGEQSLVNIVFAAAPSQDEFLAALSEQDLDWSKVNAFHMDEYVGPSASFAAYLRTHLFDRVPFHAVYYLNGNAPNLSEECERYADLLRRYPTDLICMGIGENNHIAFNDPPVADFWDRQSVKIVTLDTACRTQQVNDGCFPSLDEVPVEALTLTIPALMRSRYVCCVVPGQRKAEAVFHTLNSPITERYPSTILRRHPSARLYVDKAAAALLPR